MGLREDAARGVAGTSLGSDAGGGVEGESDTGAGAGLGAGGVCSTNDSDKEDSRGCRSPLGRLE